MDMTVKVSYSSIFTSSKSVAGLKIFLCSWTLGSAHSRCDVLIMFSVIYEVLVSFHVFKLVVMF